MDREEAAASTRRSGGGSLWSGLKQMFHPRAQGGPQPPQRPARGSSSTLSYSCLGNSRRAAEDADPYGGGAQPAQLNRNMSYSHESVFQMDPHIVQVSDILAFYYLLRERNSVAMSNQLQCRFEYVEISIYRAS